MRDHLDRPLGSASLRSVLSSWSRAMPWSSSFLPSVISTTLLTAAGSYASREARTAASVVS